MNCLERSNINIDEGPFVIYVFQGREKVPRVLRIHCILGYRSCKFPFMGLCNVHATEMDESTLQNCYQLGYFSHLQNNPTSASPKLSYSFVYPQGDTCTVVEVGCITTDAPHTWNFVLNVKWPEIRMSEEKSDIREGQLMFLFLRLLTKEIGTRQRGRYLINKRRIAVSPMQGRSSWLHDQTVLIKAVICWIFNQKQIIRFRWKPRRKCALLTRSPGKEKNRCYNLHF